MTCTIGINSRVPRYAEELILAILCLLLLAGSIVYCGLALVAAAKYLATRRHAPSESPSEGVSILKPLSGLDLGLEGNLRTFFEQDYPDFEILFAVRRDDDPAIAVVRKLQSEYPQVASRLFVTGEPPYPNAKVFSLHTMMQQAAHDLCVMSDSDIRVTSSLLQTVAAEFRDPSLGLSTRSEEHTSELQSH